MPIFLSKAYLSPTFVEAILDGNYPAHIKMPPMTMPGFRENVSLSCT